ncbi:TPA: plasmid SOS inhibition protein A [Escherichia coli]|nr:plasmid SOS inhibition protein A [Escherichia coli]
MKYDGDGRATARFFSDKGCRRAPLFTAPADAARHKRCLWSVSRVRRARDGRFYRSRLASVTVYASLSPFSDERPSSRFRGIFSPSKRRRLRYSTVGLTRYQTCFAQAQIDLAFHTPATVGSWLSRWSGVVEEHDLETIFWGWCGRFPSLSSFDRFFWQEEPLWRLIFEAGEAGRGAPVQVRALEQWMIPNKLENVI